MVCRESSHTVQCLLKKERKGKDGKEEGKSWCQMGGGILEGKKRNKRRVRCGGIFKPPVISQHVPGTKIIRRALFIPDYGPNSTCSGFNGTYSIWFSRCKWDRCWLINRCKKSHCRKFATDDAKRCQSFQDEVIPRSFMGLYVHSSDCGNCCTVVFRCKDTDND